MLMITRLEYRVCYDNVISGLRVKYLNDTLSIYPGASKVIKLENAEGNLK